METTSGPRTRARTRASDLFPKSRNVWQYRAFSGKKRAPTQPSGWRARVWEQAEKEFDQVFAGGVLDYCGFGSLVDISEVVVSSLFVFTLAIS